VLHAARSLLLETDVTAQSIARFLGFGSAAYFTRFMQQHTGRSPSRLRSGP
jgi:AraC family transcriptional activator of pobA